MIRLRDLPSARSGFTLVESAVAMALLGLLLSSVILAARGGMGAFRTSSDVTDLETRARRALDRVAMELLSTAQSELLPDPSTDFGSDDFQYRRAAGLVGTAIQWGAIQSLAFEYAPEETNDGVDNDGNGLVDDGQLVLVRDVGGDETRVVLCRGVRESLEGEVADGDDDNGNGVIDEAGFNVRRVGNVLFIRLSLEEAVDTGTVTRTLETAVRLRN